MPKKKTIVLQYKYPGEHWTEYDRTQVPAWADVQEDRMKSQHKGAEFRRGKR